MARTEATEGETQSAICEYLERRRHFFFRINNTPIYDARRGIFRAQPKYTPRGVADILVVKNGKAIFIEVRREKGKMSPEQHEFGRNVVLAGGDYHIVRSIDDVQRIGL
jgi:hypothetical protein